MDKQKLLTRFIVTISVFILLSTYYILHTTYSLAADPVPPHGKIPCEQTADPEFSSDRPYQASPCGDRPITYWCGNSVVLDLETVSTKYCGQDICPYLGQNPHTKIIDVDLSNVNLPILGNTQDTINSQSTADQIANPTIDQATAVNEYASWYLGGTNDKAEYPAIDLNNPDDLQKLVDQSGPLKKLLPGAIQDYQRLTTINSIYQSKAYLDDETNKQTMDNLNHNQTVVCVDSNNKPISCYDGDKKTQGTALKLKDWSSGDLSLLTTFFNFLGAQKWDKRYPPLPWQFSQNIYYEKAYNEWRGATCSIIPIINKLVCGKIPLISPSSQWADLYKYIPLANTTDKKGAHMVTAVVIHGARAEVTTDSWKLDASPQLYLAHTIETSQLSDLLKSTYKPLNMAVTTNGVAGTQVEVAPSDVENSQTCRIVPSRSNPGDDATFESSKVKSHIQVSVTYTIGDIHCTTPHWECDKDPVTGKGCDPSGAGHIVANCSSDIYATIPSVSKTPYANEIWNSTVAGTDSIFRRIYPKVSANAPVSCIQDASAVSNATYTIGSGTSGGAQLTRVIEPDGSATGDQKGTNQLDVQLYFPHFGGVYDYFLKGIQTALRPKDLSGDQPPSGQYCNNIKCGELPQGLPKSQGSCSLGNISSNVGKIPQSFKQVIEAAAQTYKVPPSLILGIMYGEGAFNQGGYSRYNWTEQNTKNWATCQPLPNCSAAADPINSVVPFYHKYWDKLAKEILPDLQKVDPAKTKADPCNLLDVTFALSKDLHDNAGGYGVAGKSCFGITMSSTNPTICSWQKDQYETAIKEWENGSDPSCYTRVGSCAKGNSVPVCPNDPTGDSANCETFDNHSTNPNVNSHNACVWDVATEGGTANKR